MLTWPSANKNTEQLDFSHIVYGNVKYCSYSGKQFGGFLWSYQHTRYSPALLGIYPRGMKAWHMRTCTQTFMAALFVVDKNWKPPKSPSTGEQVNKLWCSKCKETNYWHDLEGFQGLYAELKKSQSQNVACDMILFI